MAPYFKSYDLCAEFVEQNLERKHRNIVCRKSRLWRKINQQQFNFFVTSRSMPSCTTKKVSEKH